MIFEIERGKHLACNFNWADFIVTNPDIMTSLNNSPLKLQRVTSKKFKGGILGVKLLVEHISNQPSGNRGSLRVLTDVRLPFSLGRTYANATHNYFGIDDQTTTLELKIDLEVTGIISIYAWLRRRSITKYSLVQKFCNIAINNLPRRGTIMHKFKKMIKPCVA